VLGGGSNVVVSDDGLDALVVTPAAVGVDFTPDGEGALVRAEAGLNWDHLVAAAVERGYSGIEALSGIPGQVGGAPVQNIGAYGQELSQTLREATVWDRAVRRVRALGAEECGFGYRRSRFKREDADRFVVLDVTLRLSNASPEIRYAELRRELSGRADRADVARIRRAVLDVRRRKSMVLGVPDEPNRRSAGSFFTNPIVTAELAQAIEARVPDARGPMPRFVLDDGRVKLSAAWLIERSGFERGYAVGAAGLSTAHALALVNRGGATAGDLIRLARRVRSGVRDAFGVTLEPEPVFLGFDAEPAELLA